MRNRSDKMTKPTVASNHTRIVRIEEDLTDLEEKVEILDKQFNEVMAKLDIIVKMSRALVGMVAVTLGIDLGMEGLI
tara:strand:+ start:472 stop:702 length:231 start_codon:yes stop_codon:yes gene_type:complete